MTGPLASLRGDLARGWTAPPGPLTVGALVGLAVAGALAAAAGAATAWHPGLVAVVAGALQLGLAYGVAGRLVRRAAAREDAGA